MYNDELYRSVFNYLEDILLIADDMAVIIDANIYTCNFLQKEVYELKGTPLFSILSKDSVVDLQEAMQLQEDEKEIKLEVTIKGAEERIDTHMRSITHNDKVFWLLSSVKFDNSNIDQNITSTIDPLTKIYNHLKLEQVLSLELSKAMRYHSNVALSLFVLSIDGFNELVKQYGRRSSNNLLIELSRLLSKTIRTSDLVVRWDNAEFFVLVPTSDIFEITTFAAKLREIIEEHKFESIGKITCSFGVTKYYQSDDRKEQILGRALDALEKAREQGGNRVEVT